MTRYIGIDPGPTPGLVAIDEGVGPRIERTVAIQCTANALELVLWALMCDAPDSSCIVQIERFVARGRANAAQSLTRDQVGEVLNLGRRFGAPVIQRSASHVKPWATDGRLLAAGLLAATKGMRHARDAARHALFVAVHDGALPDPLSRDWGKEWRA